MTNDNTLKTRIQLKTDTEANWIAHPMVPLSGELIIYSADNYHNYSRVKIGDGVTSVAALPFIDAGTIDGNGLPEGAVFAYATKDIFPNPGVQNTLYVDLSTKRLYCYVNNQGYSQLSNFTYTTDKTQVSSITYWRTGSKASFTCEDGILKISTGILPQLNYETISVVRNLTKEVDE